LKEITGKTLEVMIFGDGAFKDPSTKIWELADPVVSPAYTSGLEGTPKEIKLKYFSEMRNPEFSVDEIVRDVIKKKHERGNGAHSALGTTPRKYTDLLGSLSDLICSSGDKGTPVVLIQGYFDDYTVDND